MSEILRRVASKDEPPQDQPPPQQQQHHTDHAADPHNDAAFEQQHHHVNSSNNNNNKCAIIVAGQLLSFLLACAGAAQATLHLDCHLTGAPTFTVGLFYLGLTVVCLGPLYGKQRRQRRQERRQQRHREQLLVDKQHNADHHHPAAAAAATQMIALHPPRSSTRSCGPSAAAYRRASTQQSDDGEEGDDRDADAIIIEHTTLDRTTATTTTTDFVSEELLQQQQQQQHQSFSSNNTNDNNNNHEYDYDCHDSNNKQHHHNYYAFLCFSPLHAPWYAYAGMAVLDVYANYVTVVAFRYTTISSVTLLDAVAIPTSMLLSRAVLQRHYTATHLWGVALCLTGIAVNVLQDLEENNDSDNDIDNNNDNEYPHKIVGDCLALLGGILFGANNVLGEIAVKNCRDPDEYIGLQSLFAVTICTVQTVLVERDAVQAFVGHGGDKSETCSLSTARWLIAAFVACNMVGYVGGARFLMHSEAAFFNLSLLTGDFWSVAFQIVAEHIPPPPAFFAAVVLTVSGVLLYELAAPAPDAKPATTSTPSLEDADGIMLFANHDDDDLAIELAPTTTTTANGNNHHNGVGAAKDGLEPTITPMRVI